MLSGSVFRLVGIAFAVVATLSFATGYTDNGIFVMLCAVYILIVEHDYTQRTQ